MTDPVRIKTPASAAAGPMVGANCHGGVTAVAMGRLKLGPMDAGGSGRGIGVVETVHKETHKQHNTTNTRDYPGSGPLCKVKPLLLLVCTMVDELSQATINDP
jgi:hypothetical protein